MEGESRLTPVTLIMVKMLYIDRDAKTMLMSLWLVLLSMTETQRHREKYYSEKLSEVMKVLIAYDG